MSSGVEILRSARISASDKLGVTKAASGRSSLASTAMASDFSNGVPLEATMTGSTMSGGCCLRADGRLRRPPGCRPFPSAGGRLKNSATARTFSADNSIPVFTARGHNSANTAWICCRSILGDTGSSPRTCLGFCAVRQAMALAPWNAKRGEGLQVGLDTRAATAVRAGDGERHRTFRVGVHYFGWGSSGGAGVSACWACSCCWAALSAAFKSPGDRVEAQAARKLWAWGTSCNWASLSHL